MDFSSSVTIAKNVMQYIEIKINSFLGTDKILLWKRYMDDICILIKDEYTKDTLSNAISFYPAIHFTLESENNCELAFLDTLIKLVYLDIYKYLKYRKAVSSGQYLNFRYMNLSSHKLSYSYFSYLR